MKLNKCGFILFVLLSSTNLFSQQYYQKGIVIDNKLDTIRGFIDQKEWLFNPREIRFKTQRDSSQFKILTPDSIKAFGVGDFEYQSHAVRVGAGNQKLFLRVLSEGQVTFYEYQSNETQRYYYAEEGGGAKELLYERTVGSEGQITVVEKYKQQLALLGKYVKDKTVSFENKVRSTNYSRSGILAFANLVNGPSKSNRSFIVTNKLDTIDGFLDQTEWPVSPKEIAFKTQRNASRSKMLTPDSIRAFGVGAANYEAHSVRVNGSSNINAFLFVLAKGKVTFYEYKFRGGVRFYYAEGSPEVKELLYEKIVGSDGSVTLVEKYKQQLALLSKYVPNNKVKLENNIRSMEYERNGILTIAKLINSAERASPKRNSSSMEVKFFAGLGLATGFANYSGNIVLAENPKSSGSLAPDFNFGMDAYFNPVVKRTFLRFEMDYTWQQFSFAGRQYQGTNFYYENSQSIKQNIFSISAYFFFTVYHSDKFRFFFGPGVRDNISSYPENTSDYSTNQVSTSSVTHTYYQNYPDWKTNWISLPATGGLVFKNKFELNLSVSLPVSLSPYSSFAVNESIALFRLKCFL